MRYIKLFEEFINEVGLENDPFLDENLVIKPLELSQDLFYVSVNGKTYGYKAKAGEDIEEIADKFKKILKHSAGKAIAWLKKNTDLSMGAGGTGPIREENE